MAGALTQQWDQHAFPDEYPAKEFLWAEESIERREETRRDIYLEQSGSDLKIRRYTRERDDGPNGKAGRNRNAMMLAIGSPAYQAAYNNQLTFEIGGEDIEITQGELHDLAKRRAEDLQKQIDAAKRRGASADEMVRLKTDLDA